MPLPLHLPRLLASPLAKFLLGAMAATQAPVEGRAEISHSVPLELRRRAAGTCDGFNLELQHAAGIARRVGDHAEADRLLRQQRDCRYAPGEVRSAAPVGFTESRLRNGLLRR